MFEDRNLRSDSRIVYALGGASPELRSLSRVVKQPSLVGPIDESILTSSRTEDFGDHLDLPAVELRPFEHPIFSVQPWKDGSMTRVVERSPRTPIHPGAGLPWPKPLSGGPSGGIIPHGKKIC
jgi:hypothetical protein